MHCKECPNEIPEARLEVSPRTVTCGKVCSALHLKKLQREAGQRWRAKKARATNNSQT